ncbi:MAG: ATP/GTP-binding protein [Mycobacteriales bacterium]
MARGSRRAAMRAAALDALKHDDDEGTPRPPVGEQVEDGHVVRRVAGTSSPRVYRCPGCDQELRPGSPHVVAWPQGRPDDRRHWHTACWDARGRRGVKVHRSKNAPRYG